ncbi:DsbC family protein [Peristeroidobacter soli]|jgi:thiol:disulfide interchange protein DsbC|uniref:DsbC family protein n=1 Tax=Peristeroidobacter soli TaxID=2497877 RepID=UPI00101E0586|nr:DsbC family protein [Peristeroidobacter soli]
MNKIFPIALTVLGAMYSAVLPAADDVATTLRKTLAERFPDIKVERVGPSVLPGLYEIVTPSEIVYSDARGDHLVLGQIMDVKTRENLTQTRWNELNKVDFNALPFEQAIKLVKGQGRRKFAIFEDPFCPFCQELERTLESLDDVTVYIFLYPLEGLHPGASDAARDIWCASDRAAAWSNWMLNKKAPPEAANCKDTPVANLVALGEKLRINSTPTLFFPDGSRVPGAIALDKLETKIAATNKR